MEKNKVLEWVKSNKIVTAVILLLSLIVLFVVGGVIMSYRDSYYGYGGGFSPEPVGSSRAPMALDGGYFDTYESSSFSDYKSEPVTTSTYLDIKEGSVDVKSEDAEGEFEVLKTMVEEQGGYVETSSKSESNVLLFLNAQVRIPVGNFEEFIRKVQEEFEVENFQLSNYRMDVQRQLDELDIIARALEDYDVLREETLKMENGEERIRLLSQITTEMRNLARQQRELERDLGSKQEQSDLATVNFMFSETLRADLWPDDLGNYFHDRIHWAIESIVTTSLDFIANSFVLFVKVIEYIVYAVVIILPVRFAWNLAKKTQKKKNFVE